MLSYRLVREELVESLAFKGIKDQRVLDAMRTVKRHQFVPPNLRSRAYEDCPLPIGAHQTISQPFMVAKMTELLDLKGDENVLEIGTGSGYQSAILSLLASKVFTVERLSGLAKDSKRRLEKLGYTNIIQKVGDGTLGWSNFAPFDRIIVTAGAPSIPKQLVKQLAPDGKLLVPSGSERVQDLKLVTNIDGKSMITSEGGCVFVPLIGSEGWAE